MICLVVVTLKRIGINICFSSAIRLKSRRESKNELFFFFLSFGLTFFSSTEHKLSTDLSRNVYIYHLVHFFSRKEKVYFPLYLDAFQKIYQEEGREIADPSNHRPNKEDLKKSIKTFEWNTLTSSLFNQIQWCHARNAN